jgi:NAD(P)-dependent dehydrogenase (short-subunit alcohol dehydrogenase family)
MKKKIIIIGGSGRLGLNLINNLNLDFNIINLSPTKCKPKTYQYIKFDLSNQKDIDSFFRKKINDISCVINCMRFRSKNKKETIIDFENTINIEIKKYFFFLEKLLEKNIIKNISILNISSTNANLVSQQFFSYHISKNLIEIFTKYFSIKYLKYNTKINTLRLGLVSTNNLNEVVGHNSIKKFNLKRVAPNYKQISQFIKINYLDNTLVNGTLISLDGSLTNIDQIYFNYNYKIK